MSDSGRTLGDFEPTRREEPGEGKAVSGPSPPRDPAADMAVCNAATPGAWTAQRWPTVEEDQRWPGTTPVFHYGKLLGPAMTHGGILMLGADAELCAIAREALPWWIAEAERLRAAAAVYDAVMPAVYAERDRLLSAIVAHHAQKADDRRVEDDDRLYAAAGLPRIFSPKNLERE